MNIASSIQKNENIFDLFKERVFKSNNKIAVTFRDRMLTYKELYQKSIGLASTLKEKGLGAGDIICIIMPNSLEYIVSILAIQRIGAICIPVDPRQPVKRIEFIVKDSNANAVLVCNRTNININMDIVCYSVDINKIEFTDQMENNIECCFNELAYCIYTSGSTGEPKGVLLHQKGIINHVYAKIRDLDLSEDDTICQSLSNSFVASIWQFLTPLILGARLIIYSEEVIENTYELFKKVTYDEVNILSVTPSTLNSYLTLVKSGRRKLDLNSIKVIVITGEKVEPSLVNSFFEEYNIPLVNAYGQSECSDDTLHYKIPYSTETKLVPIGKPIFNTKVYILDEELNVVKKGDIGELYISGTGIAEGYLNRPELTLKRFIQNPFIAGERMYRTGDLARWLPDENIEYIGRVDNQVKIRGYRIELEEIESQIMNYKLVKQAAVTVKEDTGNNLYLCAYFVAEKGIVISDLRSYLSKILPHYMIPSHFIRLNNMPQTLNGKIDRKALLNLEAQSVLELEQKDSMYGEKSTIDNVEFRIKDILRNNMDVPISLEDMDLNTDLSDLGINSITFIKIVVNIETEFGFVFDDEDLDIYKFTSLKSLVSFVESKCANYL